MFNKFIWSTDDRSLPLLLEATQVKVHRQRCVWFSALNKVNSVNSGEVNWPSKASLKDIPWVIYLLLSAVVWQHPMNMTSSFHLFLMALWQFPFAIYLYQINTAIYLFIICLFPFSTLQSHFTKNTTRWPQMSFFFSTSMLALYRGRIESANNFRTCKGKHSAH